MSGRILIVDGVSTNRILLKTRLAAACYGVSQVDRLATVRPVIERDRPDLILCASQLPDGTASDLQMMLRSTPALSRVPVITITPAGDHTARLAALSSGFDDVLSRPLDDTYLMARIRNLLRRRRDEADLHSAEHSMRRPGLADAQSAYTIPVNIAVICADRVAARARATSLRGRVSDTVSGYGQGDLQQAMQQAPRPDAYVLDLTGDMRQAGLRHLAELRARAGTGHAALIAVCPPDAPDLAADALDMGADDVLPIGFCTNELILRLATQLRRKRRTDRLRASLARELEAAVTDPMTGLYNRRYALPHLHGVMAKASASDGQFAVMVADLDHFKSVNDRFGHQAGDAVLIETARRLREGLRPSDMVARIGGEEFLMVLDGLDLPAARRAAEALCRRIAAHPVEVPGTAQKIRATISIGLVCGPLDHSGPTGSADPVSDLLARADRALYEAKHAGRNQVTQCPSAA
ncbi:MAG: diguanylate cyclase [Marinibacterium sp.]|nr:diguanylate cyclase [Marinibacterium sp.]